MCLKGGNATILRSGSNSCHFVLALHSALVKGLEQAGLPKSAIQIVETKDYDAIGEMLKVWMAQLMLLYPVVGKIL